MSENLADRRKRIYEFYLANRLKGKPFTLAHFRAERVPRQTIYDIIKRAENDSGHQRARGSGRKAEIMTPKAIKRLKRMFDPTVIGFRRGRLGENSNATIHML